MSELDPFPYFDTLTQGQIGKLFGVTSQQVGRWLIDLGVRGRSGPSSEAVSSGLAQEVRGGEATFFAWKKQRIVELLEQAGHRRTEAARPGATTEATSLRGPFTSRRSSGDGDGCEIVNSDGTVSVWVRGQKSADCLVQVMNVAHQFGKLG